MSKKTETLEFGARLANGATVIATDGNFVLAHTRHGAVHPFVTWWMAPWDGATFHGNYHENIVTAAADLRVRAEKHRKLYGSGN